ncbi:hypothetical protein PAEPH01_0630 [Pancytospora epiphaga]|nr:hypothetical protein PAEPH01_0630 [Pancytospora epiphaga]
MEKEEKTILYYTNNKNFARKRTKEDKRKMGDVLKVVDDQIIVSGISASCKEDEDGITSSTYRRKREQGRTHWNKQENEVFFKALECCGCEFSIMNILYPERTRRNLREKYKRELKQNRSRVEAALRNFKKFDKEKIMKLKDELRNG